MSRAEVAEFRIRWDRLRGASGPGHESDEERNAMFARLVSAYSEGHRHYHTIHHILSCLAELDQFPRQMMRAATEVEYAVWFHDVIFDPHRRDNQRRSAEVADDELVGLHFPHSFRRIVRELIIATDHRPRKLTQDQAVLIDIDLSIFGQSPEIFDAYEHGIRREFQHVDDPTYRHARSCVLKRFLHRPYVYWTDWFRARYEETARQNLRSAIRALSDGQSAERIDEPS